MNPVALLKNRYAQLVAAFVVGGFVAYSFYPTKTLEERIYKETQERYESVLEETRNIYEKQKQELVQRLQYEENSSKEFREETSKKLESLTVENRELRQSQKKQKFKLIKPDGTIIEKEYEASQSEEVSSVVTEVRAEFDRKVASIEDKWKKIHRERVERLQKEFEEELSKKETAVVEKEVIVEKEKTVKVSEKKWRPEVGVTTDKNIYVHTTYPLWGPIFIGGGVSVGGTGVSNLDFGDARVGVGIQF